MPDGGWTQTRYGHKISPLAPDLTSIDIRDIAYGLAGQNRFGGHARAIRGHRYNVAQHSVHVSEQVPPPFALRGLLHDASEAYLGDVPRPLKSLDAFKGYREAEAHLEAVIYQKYGLQPYDWKGIDTVKTADILLLGIEARDLMQPLVDPPAWQWCLDAIGDNNFRIHTVWSPDEAEWRFLKRFEELGERV